MAEHDDPDQAPDDGSSRPVGDTGDEPSAVSAADSAPDDGGDVAASRDPDAIATEIEQTRAELADTIDAIAERISPKRAAARGAQAVKAQVSSARDKVTGDTSPGPVLAEGYRPDSATSDAAMPVAPIAALVATLLAILVIVRRRRSR
jgi:hypothetical protein